MKTRVYFSFSMVSAFTCLIYLCNIHDGTFKASSATPVIYTTNQAESLRPATYSIKKQERYTTEHYTSLDTDQETLKAMMNASYPEVMHSKTEDYENKIPITFQDKEYERKINNVVREFEKIYIIERIEAPTLSANELRRTSIVFRKPTNEDIQRLSNELALILDQADKSNFTASQAAEFNKKITDNFFSYGGDLKRFEIIVSKIDAQENPVVDVYTHDLYAVSTTTDGSGEVTFENTRMGHIYVNTPDYDQWRISHFYNQEFKLK